MGGAEGGSVGGESLMAKYESQIKQLNYPVENVYAKLSDLNNLAIIKERFNDPMVQEAMVASGKVPEDKIEQIKDAVEKLEFTRDTMSGEFAMVGKVGVEIIDREENKCIKFASAQSPVKFNLWIQVLPTSTYTSKMRLTIDADIPFILKSMIGNKLENGIDKFADMLAMIPY